MSVLIPFVLLWTLSTAKHYQDYYRPANVSRRIPSGIAAYRAALTLDWLAAEDDRQRELVAAIELDPPPVPKYSSVDCIDYARPTSGGVARLMLELLKNLEGDDGTLVPDLLQALVRNRLLALETTFFDNEPDFDALIKTPKVMMGEPHTTFPRIVEVLWMSITDPSTVKKFGWCTIQRMTLFLKSTGPSDIAKHMHNVEPIVSRVRYIMEEFIQQVTPLNILRSSTPLGHVVRGQTRNSENLQSESPVVPPSQPSTSTSQRELRNLHFQSYKPRLMRNPIEVTKVPRKKISSPSSVPLLLDSSTPEQPLKYPDADVNEYELKAEEVEFMLNSTSSASVKYLREKCKHTTAAQKQRRSADSEYPSISTSGDSLKDLSDEDATEGRPDDQWFRRQQREQMELRCTKIHPSVRDIGKRFYSILPYFDRQHANVDFLHKFRGTVQQMSLGEDMLDREAAFYAAALTPVVFMQRYRDIWCLMERFHRALRLYQISHPTEKRSSLKLLQNLRGVNQKIREFIMSLPRPQPFMKLPTSRYTSDPFDDADLPDKKDILFLKELVKNLG